MDRLFLFVIIYFRDRGTNSVFAPSCSRGGCYVEPVRRLGVLSSPGALLPQNTWLSGAPECTACDMQGFMRQRRLGGGSGAFRFVSAPTAVVESSDGLSTALFSQPHIVSHNISSFLSSLPLILPLVHYHLAPPSISMDRLDETSAKICGVCGRAFTKTAHLIRHSRSHAEEKPFSCSVCNKGFARTDALQRHERTLHSAKRRRTGSTFAADSSDGADPADPASQATDVFPSAETFAANPMGVHSWYGEQQGNGLLSTSTGIVDMGLMEAVVPNSISPQSSFFSAFPTSAIPSTGPEVNDMIAEWLNQDTGILASDRALAALFSTPNDTEHQSTGLGGGHVSVQPASSRPFSSHGTAQGDSSLNTTRQPYTSEWLLQSQGPQAQHGRSPVDSNPGVDGPRSVPRSTATARSASNTRTILVADTWESGVTIPHSSDYSSSRPGSPQPPELTSPEQVVGQLEFRGQYVSTWELDWVLSTGFYQHTGP